MAVDYMYDPATGKWIPKASTSSSSTSSPQDSETVPPSYTDGEADSQVDSKLESDKEYIETEFNTLVGELVVTPSKKNIRLKVNDTVEVLGVGNNLSGNYFVSAIKRTLSRDSGYSQTLTVLKNGFGDSLKKPTTTETVAESRSVVVEKSAPQLKVGDRVHIIGEAIYDNGDKIPAWVKSQTLTIHQISSDGAMVLLYPIISWTYVRYVQKV